MMEDAQLLRRYATGKSEAAFAELVARHLKLVYSVALRQVAGDSYLAEDVTQQVFSALARKAATLANRPALSGWLYRSAYFAASDVVRTERRRRAREQEIHAMNSPIASDAPPTDWDRFRPVLDAAIAELGERDREAVALRFFDGRSFSEVGAMLRLTENAARMRVERSLDKLHAALGRRGITSTTAALGVVLAQQAGAAPPAGLAATIATMALAGTASSGAVATFAFMSMMKTAGVGVVVLAGATGLWWQQQTNARLNAEIAAMQTQQRAAAPRPEAIKPATSAPAPVPPQEPAAVPLAPTAGSELRTVLATRLKPLANAGTETAQATVETLYWAMNGGDVATVATIIGPLWGDMAERLKSTFAGLPSAQQAEFGTVEQMVVMALCTTPQVVGMQVLSDQSARGVKQFEDGKMGFVDSPGTRSVRVQLQYADERMVERQMTLHWYQGRWRSTVTAQVVEQVIAALGVKERNDRSGGQKVSR